jgi:3'(2'), 5'-bisphosphate nucleotidase
VAESYEHERRIAELAAQKAVIVPKKLPSFVEMGEFCKGDTTSVSLADFAAQALPVAAIHHNFPGGTIVGESMKRKIADRVWELDLTTHLEPAVEASGGIRALGSNIERRPKACDRNSSISSGISGSA